MPGQLAGHSGLPTGDAFSNFSNQVDLIFLCLSFKAKENKNVSAFKFFETKRNSNHNITN